MARLKYRGTAALSEQQIEAYRHLAASVIRLALDDLRFPKLSRTALFFLTSPLRKTERERWINWLGFDDDAFQEMLVNPQRMGLHNQIITRIQKAKAREWTA